MNKVEGESIPVQKLNATSETGDIPQKNEPIRFLKFRIIKTIFLFFSWIALGLFSEILGPALPALKLLTNSNYEQIGRALAVRASGLFIGSFLGGVLADVFKHRRNLLIFVFISVAGLFTTMVPICRTLLQLCIILFVHGFAHGGFTTSGNPSLNALWDERSTGPFSFMHAGYGVGGSLAPLLLKIFDYTNSSLPGVSAGNLTRATSSYIQPAFFIIGIYCLLIGVVFLIYFFLPNPVVPSEKPPCRDFSQFGVQTEQQLLTVADDGPSKSSLKQIRKIIFEYFQSFNRRSCLIMSIAFVGFFGIVGNERIFGKFQFSYATEGSLSMSKNSGYSINAVYWVCFTLGRIATAVVAIKVSPRILLMVEICGALASAAVFTFWQHSVAVFFVFSGFFGLFKSPLFPTMLGVLSLYGPVTGSLTMVVNFGSGFGAMVFQYLMGFLIENYGHFTFPIAVTVTALILLVIFTILLLVTRSWRQPHDCKTECSTEAQK